MNVTKRTTCRACGKILPLTVVRHFSGIPDITPYEDLKRNLILSGNCSCCAATFVKMLNQMIINSDPDRTER